MNDFLSVTCCHVSQYLQYELLEGVARERQQVRDRVGRKFKKMRVYILQYKMVQRDGPHNLGLGFVKH